MSEALSAALVAVLALPLYASGLLFWPARLGPAVTRLAVNVRFCFCLLIGFLRDCWLLLCVHQARSFLLLVHFPDRVEYLVHDRGFDRASS